MPLSLIHIGFSYGVNRQFTREDVCYAEMVRLIDERFQRLLRCYDSVGWAANGEFVLVLPGCSLWNAKILAERIRDRVFRSPFEAGGEEIHLNACFGVVSSGGRSPLVVLQEAKKALQRADGTAPGSIHCHGAEEESDPVKSLFPGLQDESLRR
jgi:GGDEF domain-containing protein